jgi:hypothetical protein
MGFSFNRYVSLLVAEITCAKFLFEIGAACLLASLVISIFTL